MVREIRETDDILPLPSERLFDIVESLHEKSEDNSVNRKISNASIT